MNQQKLSAKQNDVEHLADLLARAKSFLIFEYKGLSAKDMQSLRRTMRKSGSSLLISKNTLVGRAIAKAKIEGFDSSVLNGPNAVAFGLQDEIAPFKDVAEIAKAKPFVKAKLGRLDGKFFAGQKAADLANLPGRQDLYAMLASMLNQPVTGFARAVNAIAQKQGPAPASEPAPAAPAA